MNTTTPTWKEEWNKLKNIPIEIQSNDPNVSVDLRKTFEFMESFIQNTVIPEELEALAGEIENKIILDAEPNNKTGWINAGLQESLSIIENRLETK